MGKSAPLETTLSAGILTVTLNNLKIDNALSSNCLEALQDVVQEVYDNSEIKSVIITGRSESVFATNMGLQEIQALNELNGRKFAEQGQEVLALIENCHKPILAVINGQAVGSGFELALACHLRIATRNATFSLPAVSMGMIPSLGGTQRLTQLIGKTKALEIMMTGATLTATEAKALDLLNYIAPDKEAALQQSQELLNKIMAQAPLAVGMLINCTNAAHNAQEDGYQVEANSFANCCKTEDFKEGLAAQLSHRAPAFQGD